MKDFKFTLWSDEDNDDIETKHSVPGEWEICYRCQGNGKHTNPNIDGHGITSDEWENDWDDDERKEYMSGGYDVPCEYKCSDGKVLVPNEKMCSKEQLELLQKYNEQEAERCCWNAEEAQYRRMESGGW